MNIAMKLNSNKPSFQWSCIWAAAFATTLVLAVATAQAQTSAPVSTDASMTGAGPARPEQTSSIAFQVVPEREAVLSSQMMARVESVAFKLGDMVNQGDTLITFDCRELQARRAGAVSEQVAAVETHLIKLRLQGLGAAGELEVALAASAVDRALANVGQIDAQMINCKLVAPFTGSISRLRVKAQEVVAPNQAVVDLVDTQNLKLQLYVPAAMSRRITLKSMLSLRINDETRLRLARVSRINPRIDGASQVLEIEAVLVEQISWLKAGMLGNAQLMTPRSARLVRPKADASPQSGAKQ